MKKRKNRSNILVKNIRNSKVYILHILFCLRYNIRYDENYFLPHFYAINNIDKKDINLLAKNEAVFKKIFNQFNIKKDYFKNHLNTLLPKNCEKLNANYLR